MPETRVFRINPEAPEPDLLREAAAVILRGGLVAFPTETVYGLGANALDPEAVRRIFAAKNRPADNPVIAHVASTASVAELAAEVPPAARALMDRFWPGPLTLAVRRKPHIPEVVTAGLPTVGIRMPDHPVAAALIAAAGVPIAAPSANLSGRPSPTSAEHVLEDLDGRVDLILDGGETGVGLESTFLDVSVDPPVLLRPGGVTMNDICAAIGPISVDPLVQGAGLLPEDTVPRSPGLKYAHYAPRAPLIVVDGALDRVQQKINDLAYEFMAEGQRVGVLSSTESHGAYQEVPVVLEVGSREDLSMVAAALFSTLRAFDRHGVDVVLAEGFPAEGIGMAVMNRLIKASGGRVVRL